MTSPEKRPNIVFIMTDQHRSDHVGWSPRAQVKTPWLDRIAEGAAFLRCVSANPICMPARVALLTGRYSRQVHCLSMSGDLPREIPTYAQALQAAGYQTALVGKSHWLQTWPWGTPVGQGLNLIAMRDQIKAFGFDYVWEASGKQQACKNYCDYAAHMDERNELSAYYAHIASRGPNVNEADRVEFTGEPWPFDEKDYPDRVTTDRAVEWIQEHAKDENPFFMLFSLVSPHPPLDPPASYLEQVPYEEVDDFVCSETETPLTPEVKKRMWKLRRAYKAMVQLVDDQVGRLCKELESAGVWDNTCIVFVSDHGEMMGDHGRFQKAIHWHQSAVVPCAIRHPDLLSHARVETPVEMTDLTATLLDMAGLDPQEALSRSWPAYLNIIPGRSLLPILRGEQDRVRDTAFCEQSDMWSGLHSDRFSYVRFHIADPDHPRELLFDLEKDPDECHNVSHDPAYANDLRWHRDRLLHRIECHPPCQTSWAPWPASK